MFVQYSKCWNKNSHVTSQWFIPIGRHHFLYTNFSIYSTCTCLQSLYRYDIEIAILNIHIHRWPIEIGIAKDKLHATKLGKVWRNTSLFLCGSSFNGRMLASRCSCANNINFWINPMLLEQLCIIFAVQHTFILNRTTLNILRT